jgi:hypothetical protein
MYKIKITGAIAASDATEWLTAHDYDWQMGLLHIGEPIYTFSFDNPDHASHFALRWT